MIVLGFVVASVGWLLFELKDMIDWKDFVELMKGTRN